MQQTQPAGRIVVGVDGSPGSRAALRWAIRQAELTDSSVEAVIAWQIPAALTGFGMAPMLPNESLDYWEELAAKQLHDAIVDTVEPTCEVPVTPTVRRGPAAEVILVVGSRGHGGFAGMLLGSVSQHCARHARCPVAIIRDSVASIRAGQSRCRAEENE
jgi:nucleotide-binding universal stress UspA family protein